MTDSFLPLGMAQQAASQAAFWTQPPPIFNKPVTNGSNLIELSRMGDVAAAGSAPIGPGRFVPGAPPAPTAGAPPVPPAQARIPNPAQAAASMQAAAAQAPQALVPAPRPAGAPLLGPVPPIPPQAAARAPVAPPTPAPAAGVPATNSAECKARNYESYSGPVACASDARIEEFRKNVRGDVKTRLITFNKSFVPMNTEEKEIVVDLKSETSRDVLRYKHGGGNKRVGDLSGVVILEVRLIHLELNVKTPVTFNLTGCKGRDYEASTGCRGLVNASAAGGKYREHNPNGRVVARHFPNINRASILRYGKLRNSDLRKDITQLTGKGWSLVPINSPILEVIEASQDGLRMKLDNVSVIEDVVPVEDNLVNAVIEFLGEHISNFPGNDCTQFGITATRSSGDCFAQAGDLSGHSPEVIKYQLKEPCGFCAKFEMDYTILSNTEACSEEIGGSTTAAVGKTLAVSAIAGKTH